MWKVSLKSGYFDGDSFDMFPADPEGKIRCCKTLKNVHENEDLRISPVFKLRNVCEKKA